MSCPSATPWPRLQKRSRQKNRADISNAMKANPVSQGAMSHEKKQRILETLSKLNDRSTCKMASQQLDAIISVSAGAWTLGTHVHAMRRLLTHSITGPGVDRPLHPHHILMCIHSVVGPRAPGLCSQLVCPSPWRHCCPYLPSTTASRVGYKPRQDIAAAEKNTGRCRQQRERGSCRVSRLHCLGLIGIRYPSDT